MQPDSALSGQPNVLVRDRIHLAWRSALLWAFAVCAALMALAFREWAEMAHQWWNIDTYNHILLVPPIIAWLIALKSSELAKLEPRAWLPGLAPVVLALCVWLVGRLTGLNLIAHVGAVAMLQGALLALLGWRIALLLALPLGMTCFLVPFGDEIIQPLQMITAKIAIVLTGWSGIPAQIEGIYIDTPVGLFIVAEACSGVKFLIAMVTLAVLVCFTRFDSWTKRAAFMAAAIIVPILANGVRAWGTIYIAQFQGVEFAAGFDHIFYGWIFFGLVVAAVLGAAWRFFERQPEDYGYTQDNIAALPFAAFFTKFETRRLTVLFVLVSCSMVAAGLSVIVALPAIG